MYLKSIEIHGFKSFANKIYFKFNDGITAIVGPNGSGKSNVADAVRWVLGEQSAKQLRGSKMEDVIFSGTQLRKPMGYAYVSITFDNSDRALNIDYEEVTVARRVYRSGESEYLLNGNACRLRDVQELFFDTGIGKEGYSIIGQGQIDKILSGKPEDRRELFDEAAGIVKFKKRKNAAEKELDAEHLNLSRITDILSEIEKQVGPLERQSEKAKEYLKLKEALKKQEINAFLMDYDKKAAEKDENQKAQAILQSDTESAEKEYEDIKIKYDHVENEMQSLSEKIDANKEKKSELLVAVEKLEGDIRLMEEQKKSLYQSNAHYEQRKTTIDADINSRKDEIKANESLRADKEKQLSELKDNREKSGENHNDIQERINAILGEIDKCNQENLNLMNSDTELKSNISRLEALSEQHNIKKAQLTKTLLSNQNFESEYETAVETFSKEYDEITETINQLNQTIARKELESGKLRERLEETAGFLDKYEKEKIEFESRNKMLLDLVEKYDGYGNSIKKIMERKPFEKGIVGTVADIIEVKPEYETAIETALGGNIQNVVTKDEATAKRLIEFLKANKAGRATFLPMDAVTGREVECDDSLLKEEGIINYADKLVKANKEYAGVLRHLIGRVLVCDTMDNALKLAKKKNYSLRIVTLEGENLTPGGTLSGGSFKNNNNLLGRKREAEELEKKAKELGIKVSALSRERDDFKIKRDRLRNEINAENAELNKATLAQNTVKMKLEKEKERISATKQEFSVLELELKDLDEKVILNQQKAEEFERSIADNEKKRSELSEQVQSLNAALDEERRLERYANENSQALMVEVSSLEQAIEFIDETVARLHNEIEKLNEEKDGLASNSENTENSLRDIEDAIKQAGNDILDNKSTIQNIDTTIEQLDSQKAEFNREHKDFFDKRENLSNHLMELGKEAFRLQNQMERIEGLITEQCAYMFNEYEITVDVARSQFDPEMGSYTAIKNMVKDTKAQIKGLGDVNVNAIEQYKEVSERYELYTTQRNDIVAAEDKLKGIIGELESEMRKQFEEKFAYIKSEFDVVFKELFGGGQGTLELTEDEDILTAGIKINAQPPGKKLQNMMMLSGGERALTAIALLFAIQNLKPSPFCLLDEIEAALDDSNVGRYAKYLHKLTDHTQFIVITHRRGTMASADSLYGITMQEKGVSALVSVSLIENSLSN